MNCNSGSILFTSADNAKRSDLDRPNDVASRILYSASPEMEKKAKWNLGHG